MTHLRDLVMTGYKVLNEDYMDVRNWVILGLIILGLLQNRFKLALKMLNTSSPDFQSWF
jgi:hypothetical protein